MCANDRSATARKHLLNDTLIFGDPCAPAAAALVGVCTGTAEAIFLRMCLHVEGSDTVTINYL